MEANLLKTLHPLAVFRSLNRLKSQKRINSATPENCSPKFPSLNLQKFPRRFFLHVGFVPLLSYANHSHAAPIPDTAPDVIR
ncbi:hypothetical protein V2J09_018328 [Rumex salicifolius]